MKMPQAMKKKWVAALRSGNYKQGYGNLLTPDGAYCCLGVLQKEISGAVECYGGTKKPKAMLSINWCETNNIQIDIHLGSLGLSVSNDPQIISLVNMNDRYLCDRRKGKTFTEIADWIEQNIEVC